MRALSLNPMQELGAHGTDFVFLVFKISSGPPYKVITGWQSSSPDMHSEEPECQNELFLRGEIKEPPCKMNAHDSSRFHMLVPLSRQQDGNDSCVVGKGMKHFMKDSNAMHREWAG
jgi:hypothetical protein